MWADHRVKACTVAGYEMRHPLVGPLTVIQQTLSPGLGPRRRGRHHGGGLALAGRADASRAAERGMTGADGAGERLAAVRLADTAGVTG